MLGDQLTSLLDRAKAVYEAPPFSTLSSPAPRSPSNGTSPQQQLLSSPISGDSPSSGFTIADSDEESDSSRPSTPTPAPAPVASSTSSTQALPHLVIPSKSPLEVAEEENEDQSLSPRSPIGDQSRSLTLEEGEVFRKGAALGTGEVDEEDDDGLGDVSGEELKKEVSGLSSV